jgi:Flp pilus assembly protein TadG
MSNRLWRHATARWDGFGRQLPTTSVDPSARAPARGRSRLKRRSRGQALVELALILPVLLLLLVIAIDFGRLFATYVAVNNAAREGVAFAAAHPTQMTSADNPDPANATYRARQELENPTDARFTALTLAAPVCNPSPCPTVLGTGGGSTIKVVVTTNFTFFTPIISGFFGSSFPLSASATAVIL